MSEDAEMDAITCGKGRGRPCAYIEDGIESACWEHHAWALEDRLDAANRVIDHQVDVLKAAHAESAGLRESLERVERQLQANGDKVFNPTDSWRAGWQQAMRDARHLVRFALSK